MTRRENPSQTPSSHWIITFPWVRRPKPPSLHYVPWVRRPDTLCRANPGKPVGSRTRPRSGSERARGASKGEKKVIARLYDGAFYSLSSAKLRATLWNYRRITILYIMLQALEVPLHYVGSPRGRVSGFVGIGSHKIAS